MTQKHLSLHSLTFAEYRLKYPNSGLVSLDTRKVLSDYHSRPEIQKVFSFNMAKGREPNYRPGHYRTFHENNRGVTKMRSSYEAVFAQFLDDLEIDRQYEFPFEYVGLDENCHTYLIDFYLPDLDLFVEIKSDAEPSNPFGYQKNRDNTEYKLDCVRNSGKEIWLIMDSNWNQMLQRIESLWREICCAA